MDPVAQKEQLLKEFHGSVKACQVKYSGQRELATEGDPRVRSLCASIEGLLCHGIICSNSVTAGLPTLAGSSAVRQMTDFMSGLQQLGRGTSDNNATEPAQAVWKFLSGHLTGHERARFLRLRNICCDAARLRAWLRSALNEHSLHRYFGIVCSDGEMLDHCYHSWALMRDTAKTLTLPQLAQGLGSIYFALIIDKAELCSGSTQCAVQHKQSSSSTVAFEQQTSRTVHLLAALPRSKSKDEGLSSALKKREFKKRKKKVPSQLVSFDEDSTVSTLSSPRESRDEDSPMSPLWVQSAPSTCLSSPALATAATPYADTLRRVTGLAAAAEEAATLTGTGGVHGAALVTGFIDRECVGTVTSHQLPGNNNSLNEKVSETGVMRAEGDIVGPNPEVILEEILHGTYCRNEDKLVDGVLYNAKVLGGLENGKPECAAREICDRTEKNAFVNPKVVNTAVDAAKFPITKSNQNSSGFPCCQDAVLCAQLSPSTSKLSHNCTESRSTSSTSSSYVSGSNRQTESETDVLTNDGRPDSELYEQQLCAGADACNGVGCSSSRAEQLHDTDECCFVGECSPSRCQYNRSESAYSQVLEELFCAAGFTATGSSDGDTGPCDSSVSTTMPKSQDIYFDESVVTRKTKHMDTEVDNYKSSLSEVLDIRNDNFGSTGDARHQLQCRSVFKPSSIRNVKHQSDVNLITELLVDESKDSISTSSKQKNGRSDGLSTLSNELLGGAANARNTLDGPALQSTRSTGAESSDSECPPVFAGIGSAGARVLVMDAASRYAASGSPCAAVPARGDTNSDGGELGSSYKSSLSNLSVGSALSSDVEVTGAPSLPGTSRVDAAAAAGVSAAYRAGCTAGGLDEEGRAPEDSSCTSSLSVEELRTALHDLSRSREACERRRRGAEASAEAARRELEEERKAGEGRRREAEATLERLRQENTLLRKQLGKYISAVQLLKRVKGSAGADEAAAAVSTVGADTGVASADATAACASVSVFEETDLQVGRLPPPPPKYRDYHHEAEQYENKLIQVAEMHGELFEFSERLQLVIRTREAQLRCLRNELVLLRGPLPEDTSLDPLIVPHHQQHSSDETDTLSLCSTDTATLTGAAAAATPPPLPLVNVWIPSAFLVGGSGGAGRGGDQHHVYQVFVRIRDDEWTVYRRYAHFHALHKSLASTYPAVRRLSFPQKKPFGYKDHVVVESRRCRLQEYLRHVVNILLRSCPQLAAAPSKTALTGLLPFLADDSGTVGGVSGSPQQVLTLPQYSGL